MLVKQTSTENKNKNPNQKMQIWSKIKKQNKYRGVFSKEARKVVPP